MPAAVKTAFAIAFWFCDRARLMDEMMQPMKLQQLLFLAQSRYAAVHGGRALMPAIFVADELGPLEPNVHAAFSRGRPAVDINEPLPVAVEAVIEDVWRRYGRLATNALLRLTTQSNAFRLALARGTHAPIELDDMRSWCGTKIAETPKAPLARVFKTQTGRAVHVSAWIPSVAKTTADC
ncbi:MAG: hypothetical protein IPK66_14450 [Rhodospirillales bacterium]|nr:hypothetical protein [Rhodospirillales bacterium]